MNALALLLAVAMQQATPPTPPPLPPVTAQTMFFFGFPAPLMQFAAAAKACGNEPRVDDNFEFVALDVVSADDPATPSGCARKWLRSHKKLHIVAATKVGGKVKVGW